jgi:hypothetical protein
MWSFKRNSFFGAIQQQDSSLFWGSFGVKAVKVAIVASIGLRIAWFICYWGSVAWFASWCFPIETLAAEAVWTQFMIIHGLSEQQALSL